MALKRQHDMLSVFSMASMTDVVFLLLIFFMVTSTFVFPTALEVSLPQSSEQTAIKPSTRVYIDRNNILYVSFTGEEPAQVTDEQLLTFLSANAQADSIPADNYIAVYADEEVPYGRLIQVLDLGARNNLKMVLATKPAPASALPPSESDQPSIKQ